LFRDSAATGDAEGTLQILVTNLDYSDYFGRIAICRVFQGTLHAGDDVTISKRDGSLQKTRITKLFTFSGLKRIETTETTWATLWPWPASRASPSARHHQCRKPRAAAAHCD